MKLRMMKKHTKIIKKAFIPDEEKIVYCNFTTDELIKVITINEMGCVVVYMIQYTGTYAVVERSLKL